jgi:nitrogen fixation NifU-like protein
MQTLYRQDIIERYRFPQYRGEIKKPDLQAEVVNSFCGDEIGLFLRLDPKGQSVVEARFNGEGCALMTASADILCAAVEGKTVDESRRFSAEDLLALYGERPTPGRRKVVLLPYEALRQALRVIA